MTDFEAQLKDHLKTGADWEKMDTPKSGVFVVKVPATKTRPVLLFLEINPLKDDGKPMKRKGLFVISQEMLIKFEETMQDDKVFQLVQEMEKVNPEGTVNGAVKKLEM